jgi:hypothetical protein
MSGFDGRPDRFAYRLPADLFLNLPQSVAHRTITPPRVALPDGRSLTDGAFFNNRHPGVSTPSQRAPEATRRARGYPRRKVTLGHLQHVAVVFPIPPSPPRTIGQCDQLAPGPDLIGQGRSAPPWVTH